MPARLHVKDALATVVPTTTMEPIEKCKHLPSSASLPSRVLPLVTASACRHNMPPADEGALWLEVVNVTYDGEWTSVTFLRWGLGNDDSVSVRWGAYKLDGSGYLSAPNVHRPRGLRTRSMHAAKDKLVVLVGLFTRDACCVSSWLFFVLLFRVWWTPTLDCLKALILRNRYICMRLPLLRRVAPPSFPVVSDSKRNLAYRETNESTVTCDAPSN